MGEISGDVIVVNMKLVAGEQHERRKIGRPPNPALLQVIEDVPNGHVVNREEQFACFRFPDGCGPITDYAAETVALPPVEGSGNDSHVSRFWVEIAFQFGYELATVVETPIPSEDKSATRGVRLLFASRFSCNVEWTVKQRNRT